MAITKMKSKLLFVALAALVLLRCSNPTAGGSGTETINTFVALSGGVPAEGAVVKIIDAYGWMDSIRQQKSPVLESTTVAGNGTFSLSTESSRIVNFQIDFGSAGRFLHRVRADHLVGDTLFLDSTRSFRAVVDSSITTDYSFRLSGTTYASASSSVREISMHGIPPGTYTLVAVGEPVSRHPVIVRGLDLRSSVQSGQASLQLDFDNLLLDDFEAGVGPTTISSIFQGISWYTYSDSGAQEWNVTEKRWSAVAGDFASVGSSWMSVDWVDDGQGGKAACFTATMDYTVDPPWAGAGFRLKSSEKESVDLNSMESVSLRARGSGAITVRLETDAYDSIGQGHSQFSALVNLSETWQTHTIPVSTLSLSMPLDSTQHFVPWETASRAVNKIEFEFNGISNTADTLVLYLDDIYLSGVTTGVFMNE